MKPDRELLEEGDIYFFYQPKVQRAAARGEADVQRFYVVLSPRGLDRYRLLVIGRKRLPDLARHERLWGFVDRVEGSADALRQSLAEAHYDTRTRGERTVPAARAAGEGVYQLRRRGRNSRILYVLELPQRPGEVQEEFNIAPQGSFVLSVKNPEAGSPPRAGLPPQERADLPASQQKRFHGRRFLPAEPALLDHAGAEFVLVGAREEPREADALPAEQESARSAEIFRDLQLDRQRNPVRPLFEGRWS